MPIRTRTTTPTTPSTPSTPAAPTTPSAPTTPTTPATGGNGAARAKDVYNQAPKALKAQPPLPGAVELGDFGGAKVSVQPNGQLALGAVPTSLSEQIRAVKVAVSQAPDNQPFAAINDVQTLKTAAASAAQLYTSLLKTPRNDAEALEYRAGRAAAMGLMEAAARRAGALGDTDARDALTLGLLFSVQKEPYRPLKDFVFESTLQRAEKGELPKTKTAETALYPQKPPYDTWLKDGKISVVHYTDNDGSPREDNVQLYVDRGFKKKENADGSTTLTRKGKDGKPTIEVTIPPAPTHDKPPSLFEKMGDASVDMIIYAGHAGYGKRVEDALSKGVSGTGEGKLVMLLQCYGEGSIESVSRAFPDAHLLSTREASDDNYDLPLLDKMFDGFDKRSSYDTIAKANAKEFNSWVSTLEPARPGEDGMSEADINWYKEHDVETHYFFPNSRDVLLAKMDRDRDGVTDAGDTLFNVVYPKRVDASGGYDPLDAGAPVDGLEGTAVNASIGQLNLVARYAELPAGLLKDAPWHPEVFQSVGFYEAVSPNDPRAFKFVVDPGTNTIKVGVSSNFAHTPKEALARMMAVEAAQFLGERAGLGDAGTSALALSFLERVLHQEGGPGYSSSPVESPEVQERLFRARYGMDLSFKGLQEMSGNPDDFVAATYEAIKAKVEASPQLKALAQAQPKRATEALTVPDNLQVQGSLDKDALQRLADRLGVQGTVDPQAHQWGTWTSPGSRVAITMKDAQNKTFYVSLGIDSEGVVRAASRIADS
ncbi:MAG: hypothetical protein AB1938_27890 [Myxococcota bacterium]